MNIRKKDRPKIALLFHARTVRCVWGAFRLTNDLAYFQRALDIIPTKYKWKTFLIFLDDEIIFSNKVDDYIKIVD